METKIDLVLKQIALQKEMQQAGFNIVDCGNCGNLNIHKTGEEQIVCWDCKTEMNLSDCPDHWY